MLWGENMIRGLPEKLTKFRKENGFSQKQIAEKLNLSPSVISAYEKGERTPSVEVLLSLSYIYHCSIDYLLGRQNVNNTHTIDLNGLSKEEISALNCLVSAMKARNPDNKDL